MKKGAMLLLVWMVLCVDVNFSYSQWNLDGLLELGSFSRYIGGMSGETVFDHNVIQGSVKLQAEKAGDYGIYATTWMSYSPKGGFDDDLGDEVDYGAGVWKNFYGITFDLTYWFYDMIEINKAKGDLHGIALTVTFPEFNKVIPYICIEKDFPTDKEILDGGVRYKAGACCSLPMDLIGQKIDFNLCAGGHDGAFGLNTETVSYGRLTISMTLKAWEIDITPEVNLQKSFGDGPKKGDMAEDKFWVGMNLSWPFALINNKE